MRTLSNWPSPDKLCQNAAPPAGPGPLDLTGQVQEAKLDGFRLLVNVNDQGVEAFTRTGKSQKGKLPHIEAALAALSPGTWLDGELVAFDSQGMPEWGAVQTVMGSTVKGAAAKAHILTYVVFDILSFQGLDIRPLPLSERRAALMTVIAQIADFDDPAWPVMVVPQFEASYDYHDQLVALGYEGTIVKDPTKPYASGKRGHGWIKLKASDEMDAVIMGYKPGENSFTGMIGAIEFGQFRTQDWCDTCKDDPAGQRWLCPDVKNHPKVLTARGRCSGMDMKTRLEITRNQTNLLGHVISLKYMGIMPSGSPRHPQFFRFRPDKNPWECEWV